MKYGNIDGQGLAELQNLNFQNLSSAPTQNVGAGRFYFNTADHTLYVYNGTNWLDALAQGTTYTQGTGISIAGNVISVASTVLMNTATPSDSITIGGTGSLSNGTVNIGYQSSVGYIGAVAIGTSSQATGESSIALGYGAKATGDYSIQLGYGTNSTDKTLSVGFGDTTPVNYQLLDGTTGLIPDARLSSNIARTSALPTKISDLTDDTATYPIDKADTLTGLTASISELNIMDGVTVTASDINSVTSKIGLTDLSSTATGLTYTNTTGVFSLTSGYVIPTTTDFNAKIGLTDLSCTATGLTYTNTTGVLSLTSGYVIPTTTNFNAKITLSSLSIDSGSTNYLGYDNTTGKFSAKVDTTVTASSSNLVTSGAVEAAIGNALTGALKYQGTWTATSQTDYSSITLPVKKGYMYAVSGNATIGGVEWNSGDYLVINKDIASGGTITSSDVEKIDNTEASDIVRLAATQTLTNKTIDADDNTITDLGTGNFKSGVVRTSSDGIRTPSNASDTAIVTEKNIATVLAAKGYTAQNTALTQSGGLCTWTVTHNLNNSNVGVFLYEVSSGERVMYDYAIASANAVTIKILSTTNITANTYKAVILAV